VGLLGEIGPSRDSYYQPVWLKIVRAELVLKLPAEFLEQLF